MLIFDKVLRKLTSQQPAKDDLVPFSGFQANRVSTPFVDLLSDDQLKELNSILDWNAFTVDSHGRRFGLPASAKKRSAPQTIPDPRILLFDKEFDLKNKSVLEIGCFEGIHTLALANLAKSVTAIDSRVENVVKTLVRLGFFNRTARVFVCDIEKVEDSAKDFLKCDVLHHVGVLYHLLDPVRHLLALSNFVKDGIMLDTHIAEPGEVNGEYNVSGTTYKYKHYNEGGKKEVFSGMYNHAKWLLVEDIEKILRSAGFGSLNLIEKRSERNGSRILLIAKRVGQ